MTTIKNMAYWRAKNGVKSPLTHPEHKDHHPKKKKTESQKKKELLKKYSGGVMPL